jgi:divalent metal cation (Fe/Co/Zn/Cd) transporter
MEKIEGTPEKNGDPSKIASYSAGVNALVASGKAILAWLSGSSALLADAIHGFSDTFASLLVLVGIWLSKRKSEAFPWGLYKVENFVALASMGLIFLAGYEIIRHVFEGERAFILSHFYSSLLVF